MQLHSMMNDFNLPSFGGLPGMPNFPMMPMMQQQQFMM